MRTLDFQKIYIGFTGNGFPICIDEENDEIIYIDHDRDNIEVFINSSIAQFADSLLNYMDFIKKIKAVNGRKAFLEKNATKDFLEWITHKLEEIDSESLTHRSFWSEELDPFNRGGSSNHLGEDREIKDRRSMNILKS
ncbi:SUKH-4 family immunity protein [Paenibacillus plantiphilus]|uniref:SUKH-4 family immunity protein n=1 Tax=Paenibacillus plantiphilus TaxID=2905650 RepID=UPI001F23E262|nr:SUKH-4 family immunity protein [Paenibacillus plantiphilus]